MPLVKLKAIKLAVREGNRATASEIDTLEKAAGRMESV